jgi:hypothetical protein
VIPARGVRVALGAAVCVVAALAPWHARAQAVPQPHAPGTLVLPADSPRWNLQGDATPSRVQGRDCLLLNGAAATVKDFDMRDAVVDVDVATTAHSYFGVQFRVADGGNSEWVYLREDRSGQFNAIQYTPVLNTGLNWQLFSGRGFNGAVDVPRDTWLHLRLAVSGAQARLWVQDMERPALVIEDLKTGIERGQLGLAAPSGATCFANFQVRTTPDVAWQRHLPRMPPGTIVRWRLSPAYDAFARNLERPLSRDEIADIRWQEVEAEPPGLVVVNRFRASPHPRVSSAIDFSKPLEPRPGTMFVYGRATIESDRAQTRKLSIGYSDDVIVFLNGAILWRGRSAEKFRDPTFLGIVGVDNDAVYLPLAKGSNELILAVSELGGGWGFICRLEDVAP